MQYVCVCVSFIDIGTYMQFLKNDIFTCTHKQKLVIKIKEQYQRPQISERNTTFWFLYHSSYQWSWRYTILNWHAYWHSDVNTQDFIFQLSI